MKFFTKRLLFCLFFCHFIFAKGSLIEVPKHKKEFYQRVFKGVTLQEVLIVKDTISDNPINNKILKLYDNNKRLLGYVRNIDTTTGCDSACLPVVFTLFYSPTKSYIKLLSKPGLTKKNHAMFTREDYERLELILAMNPEIFSNVKHPTEMVDMITGATKSEYQSSVVKLAAYTSLRVNLYNQDTLKILNKLK